MSSDPNTPDFDSMSPEEMMAWMESLAKRQGADEGFTTAADMEVAEVDPDTVDESILNQKYIPDGWTEERWEAHLAKEEADKEERRAARQQEEQAPSPTPEPVEQAEPEPEPEPADAIGQPTASDDGAPDVENMSPEELMEWMESLAKRQGADEGFTTKAEMQVAEVDPSTVDESILNQKYIPGNMSEEAWDEYLKKEEAKKADKQATQKPPEPEPLPEPEFDLLSDEDFDDDDEELGFDLVMEDTDTEAVGDPDNPMSWLENLASTDEDSEELEIPDLSGFGDDLSGLSDLVADEDDGDPMDWLSSLAGAVDEDDDSPALDFDNMSAGLEGLEGLEAFSIGDDDEEDYEEDESIASLGDFDTDDPENFLESLARLEGAPEDELSSDATTPIPDFLSIGDNDIDDVLEDTQPSEEIEPAWDIDDPNSIENPEAWLDALAANSAGDTDSYDIEDEDIMFDEEDDVEDDTNVIEALNSGKDVSPEDIQGFFAGMFEKAEEFAHLDDDLDDDEEVDDEEVGEAVAIDMPEWLQELSGGASAQDDDDDEGDDILGDVLAGLEEDAASLPDVVELEEDAYEVDDADDELAEPIDIPDWLMEGAENDTGDVIADIIADEFDASPGETTIIDMGDRQIEVDPNDTWTQAFLMEDREEAAEEWYTEKLSQLDMDEAVAQTVEDDIIEDDLVDDVEAIEMTSPAGSVSLEPAAFPMEEDLPEGRAELAPEWLTGEAPDEAIPMEFEAMSADDPDIEIPDWLEDSIEDDDIEIPDWLTEADDDDDDAIPDWLASAGVDDIEPAEIPAWLTDTVEEPGDFIIPEETPAEPEPAAIQPVQPVQPIVAPPAAADIAAAIESAQQKVASDDLDGALQDYEAVVRANDGLDTVIDDLEKLTKDDKHKKNPAVYRVLGDAKMRAGDLQDALDVYRRALNLL